MIGPDPRSAVSPGAASRDVVLLMMLRVVHNLGLLEILRRDGNDRAGVDALLVEAAGLAGTGRLSC
jgi:hypothetical protein